MSAPAPGTPRGAGPRRINKKQKEKTKKKKKKRKITVYGKKEKE